MRGVRSFRGRGRSPTPSSTCPSWRSTVRKSPVGKLRVGNSTRLSYRPYIGAPQDPQFFRSLLASFIRGSKKTPVMGRFARKLPWKGSLRDFAMLSSRTALEPEAFSNSNSRPHFPRDFRILGTSISWDSTPAAFASTRSNALTSGELSRTALSQLPRSGFSDGILSRIIIAPWVPSSEKLPDNGRRFWAGVSRRNPPAPRQEGCEQIKPVEALPALPSWHPESAIGGAAAAPPEGSLDQVVADQRKQWAERSAALKSDSWASAARPAPRGAGEYAAA